MGSEVHGLDLGVLACTATVTASAAMATVRRPVVADTVPEPDATLALALSVPTGGATLGAAAATTCVAIAANDLPAGGFALVAAKVMVAATAGMTEARATRTAGAFGQPCFACARAAGRRFGFPLCRPM